VVDLRAVKKFSVAPKMVATIFPIEAVASNRRPAALDILSNKEPNK
jgi:hypothetical protein